MLNSALKLLYDFMRKLLFLLISVALLICGCAQQESQSQTTFIGNPWSDWDSVAEAEAAVGFSFGLPEVIADSYTAAAYRTMNNQLMEVIYRDGDSEIRVRKQPGEGQDISGDYNQYDTCTEEAINSGTVVHYHNSDNNALKQIISCNGYSWSVTASDGFPGDSNRDFLNLIFGE